MSTRGKWGITRDEDGSLSNLWEWPWYWRYPAAVTIALAGLLYALHLQASGREDWTPLFFMGVALLFALMIAYETGCLAVVALAGWGIYALVSTFMPDIRVPLDWRIGIVGAGAVYAWFVGNEALRATARQQREIDATYQRVNRESERLETNVELLYEKIHRLEDRIRQLEKGGDAGFEYFD